MTTKSTDVKGTITETTILTPICYDALGEPVRVDSTSVEAALKSIKLEADVLGFEFSQASRVRLQTAGGEKLSFSRNSGSPKVYMFAEQVFGAQEYAKLADPANPLSRQFNSIPKFKRDDPDSVAYTSIMGVSILHSCDHERVVLIDKKGTQLFPRS